MQVVLPHFPSKAFGRLLLTTSRSNHVIKEVPITLLSSFIQLVNITEHVADEMPNRLARSSFNNPRHSFINVRKYWSLLQTL